MYNPNNPSNWSWSKAFDEVNYTIRKAELEQQIINHLHGYKAEVAQQYQKVLVCEIR